MTTERKTEEDHALEAFFAASRDAVPTPDSALMARIAADAAGVQAGFAPVPVRPPVRSWRDRLSDALGGWAGVSALAACACVGLLVGVSQPDAVLTYVSFGQEADDASANFLELVVADAAGLEG